jgi:hypothetical protein
LSTNSKALNSTTDTREEQRPHPRREAFLTIMLLMIGAIAFVVMDEWIIPLSGSGHGFI